MGWQAWTFLIGRLLFGGTLGLWAVRNLTSERGGPRAYAVRRGLPPFLVPIAQVVLLVGGLAVAFGVFGRIAASVLALQFLVMTLVMHRFWLDEGDARDATVERFRKGLMLTGACMVLAAWPEPWVLSVGP